MGLKIMPTTDLLANIDAVRSHGCVKERIALLKRSRSRLVIILFAISRQRHSRALC